MLGRQRPTEATPSKSGHAAPRLPLVRVAADALPPEVTAELRAAEPRRLCRIVIDSSQQPISVGGVRAASYQRILLERRRARGWDQRQAAAALESPAVRTICALIQGDCEAALVGGNTDGDAVGLLEGGPVSAPVRLYVAEERSTEGSFRFGWLDSPLAHASAVASHLASAKEWLSSLLETRTAPVVIRFRAAKDELDRELSRLVSTLEVRGGSEYLEFYSSLFFANGRLSAPRIIGKLRAQRARLATVPVVYAPQISMNEFVPSFLESGGAWAGAFIAGAELPAALLREQASVAEWSATLRWLAELAARELERKSSRASSG